MSMRAIYRKIGKKHGVSPMEVKMDMQAAIDYAFQKPDKSDKEKNIQRSMPHKGAVPTTDEFVQYLGYKIKRK
ncbi:sporulation initiation factor Spo0A [Aminipila terrae]|uniref:Sporulation initiation factor Spo0A n=2 Tax=Aminipila terrae TaxID=2697030 RepID=A0A6P1MDG6_9FIRM|nr:sporulation initiation factor Spo0A [Aminipila terrae]